jgi:hypothetical protein
MLKKIEAKMKKNPEEGELLGFSKKRAKMKRRVDRHREQRSRLEQTPRAKPPGYLQIITCRSRKNSPRRREGSPK